MPSLILDPDPDRVFSFSSVPLAAAFDLSHPGVVAALIVAATFFLLLSAFLSGGRAVFLFPSRGSDVDAAWSTAQSDLMGSPRLLHDSILTGTTVFNLAAVLIVAVLAAVATSAWDLNPVITLVIQIVVLSMAIEVLVHIIPQLAVPRHAALFEVALSRPLFAVQKSWAPVHQMMERSSDALRERLKRSQNLTNDELKAIADAGEAQGTIEEEERELIHSIVEFGETTVREVMISRVETVALPITASVNEAVELIRTSGHSRLPLYVEHLDNIAGILYAKDLLPYLGKDRPDHLDWTRLARRPMFVPPGKRLDALLKEFQSRKTHIAIVVDEYGGTAGLVTLEDVLEEIVGDIRDEHDEYEPVMFEEIEPGVFLADGRINLDDLDEMIDSVNFDADQYDFETLGGLIFHLKGAIPEEGEEIFFDQIAMRVESRENHRIGKVLIRILSHDTKSSDAD